MRRAVAFLLVAASALCAAEPALTPPRVTRVSVETIERSFDKTILRSSLDDKFALVGNTRGIYIEGFGAVFTAEINLVANAVISPFKTSFTKEEIAKVRLKKQERLPQLKENMRQVMLTAARDLEGLPEQEMVTMAVCLFYSSWEDKQGLPYQVILQAPRKTLLAAMRGQADKAVIQEREY